MDNVQLREMIDPHEYYDLLEVQRAIWGLTDGEATSPYIFTVGRHNGGVIIVAEIDEKIIGFCFGFPAPRGEQWVHWSHMTGIIPEYQGQDIGFTLKQAQREWCLAHGYTVMGWTFDPIQRGNANFNFHRLGAVANRYIINHYGEMTDDINAGLPSDRLEVMWHLDDERVIALADAPKQPSDPTILAHAGRLLAKNDQGVLVRDEGAFAQDTCIVEMPYHIQQLKSKDFAAAQNWQLEIRWAMQTAFAHNYSVVAFTSQHERGWYVLQKDR